MRKRLSGEEAAKYVEREVKYKCMICTWSYNSLENAIECASRGYAPTYPIGCIYGNHKKGHMYENITFAVAQNRLELHSNLGYLWACRDTGAGDTLNEEMCSGGTLTLNEHYKYLDVETPHFKRMVKYLTEARIPITVWDGEKAVPYEEYNPITWED